MSKLSIEEFIVKLKQIIYLIKITRTTDWFGYEIKDMPKLIDEIVDGYKLSNKTISFEDIYKKYSEFKTEQEFLNYIICNYHENDNDFNYVFIELSGVYNLSHNVRGQILYDILKNNVSTLDSNKNTEMQEDLILLETIDEYLEYLNFLREHGQYSQELEKKPYNKACEYFGINVVNDVLNLFPNKTPDYKLITKLGPITSLLEKNNDVIESNYYQIRKDEFITNLDSIKSSLENTIQLLNKKY